MAEALERVGASNIVIKTGKDGCYVYTHGKGRQIPAFKPKAVVDTTGAGDNFVGAFITAISKDMVLEEAARYANAAAAVSVTSMGSTGGLKNKEQIATILNG